MVWRDLPGLREGEYTKPCLGYRIYIFWILLIYTLCFNFEL